MLLSSESVRLLLCRLTLFKRTFPPELAWTLPGPGLKLGALIIPLETSR